MKKHLITSLLMLSFSINSFAQPRESLSDKIRKAYSLVGRWDIVKMEVDRSGSLSNPSNVPETAMGAVTVLLRSELGESGYFDIAPGGAITGSGKVKYEFNVSAGTSAFSWGPVNLPIGAAASMHQDNGIRNFSFTGSADLSARTIFLNVFEPTGSDLKMIIRPGGRVFTSAIWPPMTKVGPTKVMVNGSSMLLRVSGVLSGIKLNFEAVKYVDMAGLFKDLEQYIDYRITTVSNNSNSNVNPNSSSNNNNTTNNPPTTTTINYDSANGGRSPLIAGSVTVAIGASSTVVFRIPQATTNYAINLTPMNVANSSPVVTFSDKTTNGFKIHVKGTGTAAVKIDWVATPYTN